jgi:hypothetical protein
VATVHHFWAEYFDNGVLMIAMVKAG